MRVIDYTNKVERKIDGMFYVENLTYGNKELPKVIFSADQMIVKPAFDYIRERYLDGEYSRHKLERATKSICHYLNFCKLHRIDIEQPISNQYLKAKSCFIGLRNIRQK